jgi:hypothetical protein
MAHMIANEREQAERRAAAVCAALGLGPLLQDGKISEAANITDQVVMLDPDSAWAHAIRARLHAKVGLFKDAIIAFRTAFEFAKREDNSDVLTRICHDVLETWQVVIDKFGQHNASDYTVDPSIPEPTDIQRPPMEESFKDIDKLAANLPEAARASFMQKARRDFEMASAMAERGASAPQIAAAMEDSTLGLRSRRF